MLLDNVTTNKYLLYFHALITNISIYMKNTLQGSCHIAPPHIYSGPECESAQGFMILPIMNHSWYTKEYRKHCLHYDFLQLDATKIANNTTMLFV